MIFSRYFFPLLFLFLAGGNSSAQLYFSLPDTALYNLDTLTVEASRSGRPLKDIPFSVSVVGRKTTQMLKTGLSLENIMFATAGLQVDYRNNLAQGDRISIRGIGSRASFGVRGIKVVLDGIPLTMPDGQSQLNNIDLSSVERVEVIKGPTSALYGNASGGVILLQSTGPAREKPEIRVGSMAGSFSTARIYGSLSAAVGQSRFTLNSSVTKSDGFREHAQARLVNVNLIGRQKLTAHSRLSLVLNYFNAPYLLNPSSLNKADSEHDPQKAREYIKQQGSGKRVSQGQGGVTYQYKNAQTEFIATAYGVSRSLFNAIPGRIIDLDREAGGLRMTFTSQLSVLPFPATVTFGNDAEAQTDNRIEYENRGIATVVPPADRVFEKLLKGEKELDQREGVFSSGTFLQLQASPSDHSSVLAGLRYDHFRFNVNDFFLSDGADDSGTRTMSNVSPMIGLTFSPARTLTFYGNLSTGFQTPTASELSNRPSGAGGFNPGLNPEQLRNVEIGLRGFWLDRNLQYSAAAYLLTIGDMLIPYQVQDPASEEIYYRNAGKSENHGAEVELGWYPLPWLILSLNYSYSNFRFKDFLVQQKAGGETRLLQLSGNRVPGISPHRMLASIRLSLPASVHFQINLAWSDSYFANDLNGNGDTNRDVNDYINDGYLLTDLYAGWRRDFWGTPVKIYGQVSNLFNVRHNRSIVPNAFGNRFFEPAAARGIYVGIELGV